MIRGAYNEQHLLGNLSLGVEFIIGDRYIYINMVFVYLQMEPASRLPRETEPAGRRQCLTAGG